MTTGKIQAKDIPDKALIDLVDKLWNIPNARVTLTGEVYIHYSSGAKLSDICKVWDTIPVKVIQLKLKKLVDRKLLDGCPCGCSGNFTVVHDRSVIAQRVFDFDKDVWKVELVPRTSRTEGPIH